MTELIEALPNGLVPPMKENEGNELPEVRLEMPEIVIPVLVRKETKEIPVMDGEEGETEEVDVYRYFEVRTEFDGGDITDYAGIVSAYWKPIREAFYGTPEFQADLDYDHRLTGHILAVKDTFRKPGQNTPPEGIARWAAVKAAFWATVDEACAAVGKTREDLPAYFNDTQMVEFAVQNGMSASDIASYSLKFALHNLDAGSNKRNWSEFFR